MQIEACGCNQRADRPFDFSAIPNPTRRTGFCDLHGAILKRTLWERKPIVSENDNRANAPAWRHLTERLGKLKEIKKLLLAIYYPNPANRFRSSVAPFRVAN